MVNWYCYGKGKRKALYASCREEIRKTGEVEFVGLGIKLTKDNLKFEKTEEVETTEK